MYTSLKGMSVMNKTKKRQQTVKQKLIAAIAMLMVSAIMVVSSSYAWFTLSTKPEVTGIQTSVGANGNLEMALNAGTITSGVGDSTKADVEKNITWGNLVNLSDEAYGLRKIALLPSRLNLIDGKVGASILATPTYGADGRVNELVANTLNKSWVDGSGWTGATSGVQAIGNASGMSAEQLALRQAKIDFANAITTAQRLAAGSLNTTGEKLTAMAVAVKMNGATTVAKADVEAVQATLVTLTTAKDSLGTALLNYLYALATTQEGAATVIANTTTIDEMETLIGAALAQDTNYSTAKAAYDALATSLESASTNLESAIASADADGNIAWTAVSSAMAALVDTDQMVLNGYKLNEITLGDGGNAGDVASAVVQQGGLKLVTTAGVYSAIADFTGSYTASFKIAELTISGVTVTDFPASMIADPSATYATVQLKTPLSLAMDAVTAFVPDAGSADTALTDLFGYKIDLAFRTNAAGSYLKLQRTEADRIYNDNGSDSQSWGSGSYMEFDIATLGYTKDQAKEVMKAIRIVFTETVTDGVSSATIYGVAVLDMADGNYEETANGIKASLKMVEYTTEADGTRAPKLIIGADKTGAEADKLMDLPQSAQANMSVIVYLDGDHVENKDVATGGLSLEGKLNLQFASSAELTPMDYSPLHTPQAP